MKKWVLLLLMIMICFLGYVLVFPLRDSMTETANVASEQVTESDTVRVHPIEFAELTSTQIPESESESETEPSVYVPKLNTEVTVEAGITELNPSIFFEELIDNPEDVLLEYDSSELFAGASEIPVTVTVSGRDYECYVTVVDTTAPVFESYKTVSFYAGDTVSYKKMVTVTDNSNDEVELSVDTSAVNRDIPGAYSVTYTAADKSGNTATLTVPVTVLERFVCSEETVSPLAAGVVGKVTNSEMTDLEKAAALINWCRTNISYTSSGNMESIWTGAYDGLSKKRGDCWSFAATYSVLLSKAGVENVIVSRIGGVQTIFGIW